ncbi:SPFH domain-containing protein [Apilactobacillus xinyiensis]|uniref:SPFH domain-containing protein n=1 Tax=Apilactobacillus xinyiensis TaxID=2841032 RepID=UPI00336529AA
MSTIVGIILALIMVVILFWVILHTVIIINESQGEVGLKMRLGKYVETLTPGWHFVIPIIYSVIKVDTRQKPLNIKEQSLITRDNATVLATEQLKYHVTDAVEYELKNSNAEQSMIQDVQSSLRSIIGGMKLNDVLEGSGKINERLANDLNDTTARYGTQVDNIAISGLKPDPEIEKAMNQQAAAERQREAAIMKSQGEKQAAQNQADGRAYALRKTADADAYTIRQNADAKAYQKIQEAKATAEANNTVINAFGNNGFTNDNYIALKQIQAYRDIANSSANTVVVPQKEVNTATKTAEAIKIAKTDNSFFEHLKGSITNNNANTKTDNDN